MNHCPYSSGDHLVTRCPQACPTCHGGQEIFVHTEEGLHAYTLHLDSNTGGYQRRVHLAPMTCPTCHGTGMRPAEQEHEQRA